MLRLDVRASVLARLVSRKENYPPRLLRVAFKHRSPHAPRLVSLLYQMLGPNRAHQPSRTCPASRPAAHALTPALDRLVQPAANCASPGWKSNGGTDGGARSIQKCPRRSVRPGPRSARPREVAQATFTSERAIATRCCSPPESSPARCLARLASPTSPSQSAATLSACPRACPRISKGSPHSPPP